MYTAIMHSVTLTYIPIMLSAGNTTTHDVIVCGREMRRQTNKQLTDRSNLVKYSWVYKHTSAGSEK